MSNKSQTELSKGVLPMASLPSLGKGAGFSFLSDVVVVDLTTSIAGPYSTMLLGDFGADVIKVERIGTGDDARAWGPPFLDGESLWFTSVNRNKRSVSLDTSSDEGRAILYDLVRRADVVVLNQPPGTQEKLGLDYETLKAIREDLVFVSITGFGLEGERANYTCYDLIAEGYSGIMDITGARGGDPQKIGAPAADMLAGQDAAMATIAALFDRAKTGKGRRIDVSLVESMTRFLSCRIVPYMGSGEIPTRSGGTDSVIAIYQSFDTADLPITLGLGNDRIWRRFWDAVGNPDYAEKPEFKSNTDRRENRTRIIAEIAGVLITRPRAHWLKVLADARVPAGPINRVDEVVADPALQERGLFFTLNDGDQRIPQVGLGIQFDGAYAVPSRIPPRLGEHTEAVLSEMLGLTPKKIEQLNDAGIVSATSDFKENAL